MTIKKKEIQKNEKLNDKIDLGQIENFSVLFPLIENWIYRENERKV